MLRRVQSAFNSTSKVGSRVVERDGAGAEVSGTKRLHELEVEIASDFLK